MMTYEYKCQDCGEIVTRRLSISDEKPKAVVCDHCTGKAVRVFAIPGFSIKHQHSLVNVPPGRGAKRSDTSKNQLTPGGGFDPHYLEKKKEAKDKKRKSNRRRL